METTVPCSSSIRSRWYIKQPEEPVPRQTSIICSRWPSENREAHRSSLRSRKGQDPEKVSRESIGLVGTMGVGSELQAGLATATATATGDAGSDKTAADV